MFCPLKLCTKSEEEISVFLSFVTIFTVSLVEICTLLSALLWFFLFYTFLNVIVLLPPSFFSFILPISVPLYLCVPGCVCKQHHCTAAFLLPYCYLLPYFQRGPLSHYQSDICAVLWSHLDASHTHVRETSLGLDLTHIKQPLCPHTH